MRISILQIILFTVVVAVQLRSYQLRELGLMIVSATIPICLSILMLAAFLSQSRDGRLVVEENTGFVFVKTVLYWCLINLVILIVIYVSSGHR